MTVGRFTSARGLATRLIAKNGERSSYVRVTDVIDPAQTNRVLSQSSSPTTVDAVWFEWTPNRLEGQLVKTATREVWISAESLGTIEPNPTTDHIVRVDGTRWKFLGPGRTIQPNEDLIVHQLFVRQE